MVLWRDQILAALEPCTDADMVEAVVGKLLLGFENGQQNAQATRARNEEYVTALDGLPLWAIMEAADRFRTGEVLVAGWNKGFRPAPPQFADEVREGLADLRRQQIQIRDVLDAEILPEPDPEAVARARRLAAEVSAHNAVSRRDGWLAAPDVRDGAEILPAERVEVLAGPPIKPGALGASALGRFVTAPSPRATTAVR